VICVGQSRTKGKKMNNNTQTTLTRAGRKHSGQNLLSKKYKIKFDIKPDAIDLRTMAENYPNGIIPLEDIHQLLLTQIPPQLQKAGWDPRHGGPHFEWVDWNQLALDPTFQRDAAPTHISKINREFVHSAVIVPCAIRMTVDGHTWYFVWDGHHTIQVLKLQNYTHFPVWCVDMDKVSDEEIKKAGFNTTVEGRIRYGKWRAGNNMIMINSKNKRKLSPYDEIMIKIETGDQQALALNNIVKKNTCVFKRHAGAPGAFTQVKSAEECYMLTDSQGSNTGQYLDRALALHRAVWPMASIELEIFRPLAYLYQRAAIEGYTLDAQFDSELTNLLVQLWGDPVSIQTGIKDSYWRAYHDNTGKGIPQEHDKFRVMCGMINIYNQKIARIPMPSSPYIWTVKVEESSGRPEAA